MIPAEANFSFALIFGSQFVVRYEQNLLKAARRVTQPFPEGVPKMQWKLKTPGRPLGRSSD